MNHREKEVQYTAANTYSTLNQNTENTRNIWIVFHGLGYLSRYFINYFKELNSEKNYIIAPQAPSKFYQDKTYTYVGASWLTKENTLFEMENVANYLNSVVAKEKVLENSVKKLILLGFSQGVSVMLRWIAKSKFQANTVVIHSGGIPKELVPEDFEFLSTDTQIFLIYGKEDEYINEERAAYEKQRAEELFKNRLTIVPFEGKHQVNVPFINALAK